LALGALALYCVLSFTSDILGFSPNLGGPLGAALAQAAGGLFGYQSWLVTAMIAYLAILVWRGDGLGRLRHQIPGATLVVVALTALGGLVEHGAGAAGGAIGNAIANSAILYLNIGGSYLAVALTLIAGVALALKRAPTDLAREVTGRMRRRGADSGLAAGHAYETGGSVVELPVAFSLGDDDDDVAGEDATADDSAEKPALRLFTLARGEAPRKPGKLKSAKSGGYKLPSPAILDTPPAQHAMVDESALERSARALEQKLADFGVEGRVVAVQPGPVVTMYKFEPGSGIKVSQIVNLADDLSMALRAATVRIQAPVPGEAVVGIEVPNRKRELVFLREILDAGEFQTAAPGALTIALGKDISGRPMAADLARMPHLLIAGATGTGKSVSIHTMIASILFSSTADDVRFVLIDPKMLELSVYENIPHLLVPVVVDPEKAAAALLWATQEMENRYRLMRDLGVRNIDGYNSMLRSNNRVIELKAPSQVREGEPVRSDPATEHRRLPKIVIVIDELADLLLSEGKTVERDITRLAQKARAAGIHLILATQRPSVDVITGIIKANLPARISLQVTSRVDSRTILDSIGAERLLGAGDMLFMPPGSAKLIRLHGPFVSESEIRKLTDFLREQGAPDYQMEILETRPPGEEHGDDGAGGAQDELYDEAVRIVLETNQASISMIQRRLRVGYNRAARMVEQMEREGLVAPPDGARPREVRGLRGAN
jgi:S-DNA-T family DNA segregation ATPase FtsK/SpoIIIE